MVGKWKNQPTDFIQENKSWKKKIHYAIKIADFSYSNIFSWRGNMEGWITFDEVSTFPENSASNLGSIFSQ